MAELPDKYIPRNTVPIMRRQAVRVWVIASFVVLVWACLIVTAPLAKNGGAQALSSALYGFFGYICHQIPERTFHLAGEPFAVCSRCFGVYFGLLLGFVIYPLWRPVDTIEPLPRFWLFLSLIPIAIDWSLTILGVWENTQVSRLLTGLILGIACATFIVPALVEITRNLTARRTAGN